MKKISLGFGGPAIVTRRGVFGRLVASRPNLAAASIGGFDGVLTVSSSSELSSSPEIGALAANGELRVGRVDGRPIPSPVGVLVGLEDTIGIEDDDSDLTGELDGVWGGEEVVSWSLDVSFNRRLDDTEFENILVVGIVSGDPPNETPSTSCIFDWSRNCVHVIQQPVLVFPRDSEEFAVAHSRLGKGMSEAVTSVVGDQMQAIDFVLFIQVVLILEQRK